MGFWKQVFCKHINTCYKQDLDYEEAMINRKLFIFEGIVCPDCQNYKPLGVITNRSLTIKEYSYFIETGNLPRK